MKKIIIWVLLFLFCCVTAFSINDYSNVKGDFKIFCIGDTEEIACEKIDFLIKKGIVFGETFIEHGFFAFDVKTSEGEARCSLNFDNKRLYWIQIVYADKFKPEEYNKEQKQYLFQVLIPALSEIYGKPSHTYQYPDEKEFADIDLEKLGWGDTFWVADWILKNKTIGVGITMEQTPDIVILDNEVIHKIRVDNINSDFN